MNNKNEALPAPPASADTAPVRKLVMPTPVGMTNVTITGIANTNSRTELPAAEPVASAAPRADARGDGHPAPDNVVLRPKADETGARPGLEGDKGAGADVAAAAVAVAGPDAVHRSSSASVTATSSRCSEQGWPVLGITW